MKLVEVKFEIPEDLEPRVLALAKRLGVSFDIMVEMLMSGHIVSLRAALASAERILSRSESEGATV